MEKEGYNQLFERIYLENFSYVYNFIYMKVLHKETAEEICSDVFMRAFRGISSYDPQKAGARTWLCVIAKNLLINYYKKRSNEIIEYTDEPADIAVKDDYGIMKQSANREVERLFRELSDDERELLSLRFGMELSIKEIAEMKDVSQNAMTHRIGRILDKFKKLEERSGNELSDFVA